MKAFGPSCYALLIEMTTVDASTQTDKRRPRFDPSKWFLALFIKPHVGSQVPQDFFFATVYALGDEEETRKFTYRCV